MSERASERPDAIAVTLGDDRLTYGELERLAIGIAGQLVAAGARPDDRVSLFVPKSPLAVAAMLGCLRAGCVYVPIDLASPPARLALIVESADPALALVTEAAIPTLDAVAALGAFPAGCTTVALDELSTAVDAGEPPPVDRDPSAAAHILFTSGSTGVPKGVVITHANVAAFVDWAIAYFGISADDRVSGHAPFHFDLSTFDIFGALWSGAELHLVPPSTSLLPRHLASFIEERRLTQWFSVPTVLSYMEKLGALPERGFPSLTRILWCGDVLPTPVLRSWMRRHPQATFTNLYGPTEATIASSYHTLVGLPPHDTSAVPIGRPCGGEELLVLDSELVAVEPRETGDLYLGGAGLSPGYWRDDEKTAQAFLDDPRGGGGRIYRTGDLARVDDGLVYFVGRSDSQIKSRGHRIELGEIEVALNSLAAVREVAVVAIESGDFDGKAICCAWAPTDVAPPAERLKAELQSLLPSYMLPSRWLRVDVLPKNTNGKIDRRGVRELFEGRAAGELPVAMERGGSA